MRIIFLNLFPEHNIIWSDFSQVCGEAKLKESICSKVKIHIYTPPEKIFNNREGSIWERIIKVYSTFKQSKYLSKITTEEVVGWLLSGSFFTVLGLSGFIEIMFSKFLNIAKDEKFPL